ncbi:hypothetical protein SETIT_1G018000v2 [Setaria italica]|uniref:RING-type E3 ubiquitin transferase n=2 Tax=Setaria italica TaxID=4555 RepID=A0A368PFU4_SETIT|nr:RING-H2 finger protein ATL79 [Setaria italica]RCV04656.1 hypothetical protein SETIT_1G018000v2 [Setaria italica]
MSVEPADTCYRWTRDFAVAHAMFGTGLITLPVAVLHLAKRPHTGGAAFFAVFAVFFAAVSLTLCCRFYAELKRPPWPRWLSAASVSAGSGDETTTTSGAVLSHDLRHPGQPVMTRVESYEHCGGSAADCAVCLGEVEKGETVRRLPACGHVFQTECIDVWLSTHATCPVCRRSVTLALERPREVVVDIGVVCAQPGETMPAQPGMIFADQARASWGV